MAKKILILMSETGGGHRSAAEAIAGAIEHLHLEEGKCEVEIVDVFSGSYFPVNLFPYLYAMITVHFPPLWGWSFHLTNGRYRSRILAKILELFIREGLKRALKEKRSDVIVSVHPLLNQVTCKVLQDLGWKTPFLVVVTELATLHQTWVCPDADCYIVPTKEMGDAALRYGMPLNKIELIGPPVKAKFLERPQSKEKLREELGLDPHLLTVLLVGGGEGTGRVYDFACAISNSGLRIQLIIIAGRNRRLKAELERANFDIPVKIQGFVDNMPQWMYAADLLVTRAGPGVISEALVCELPMVLSGALPGQEKKNIDYVLKNKVGKLARTPQELIDVLRALSQDRAELSRMAENARNLTQPQAIYDIARLIINASQ